jgi:hypothetical protein
MMRDSRSDREPLEELAEAFVARLRAGEASSLAEVIAGHPELADQIRSLVPALIEMELAGSAIGPTTGTVAMPDATSSARLESLGGYQIIREIGRGAMGVVYEAQQIALGRRVALKVLPRTLARDPRARARFDREARAAARLHHTNIVPVFDVGHDGDSVFYPMQMIDGQGLDVVIAEVERLRGNSAAPEPSTSIAAALALDRFAADGGALTENHRGDSSDSEGTGDDGRSTPGSAVLPGQSDLASALDNRRQYY